MRFNYKGVCSAEDLWDLTVEELDFIYKGLKAKLRLVQEESLLDKKSDEDAMTALQVDIVKHIVEVKQQEALDKKLRKERKEKKQKLMEILAMKQDADLQGKSTDEIMKMIDELE